MNTIYNAFVADVVPAFTEHELRMLRALVLNMEYNTKPMPIPLAKKFRKLEQSVFMRQLTQLPLREERATLLDCIDKFLESKGAANVDTTTQKIWQAGTQR